MMLSAPEKDGKIIEIDNDIIKSSYKNYLYENKQSDVKIYFPKNLKDEFEIRYGEKSVKIKLHEDLKNCSDGCVVSHKNSFGNTVRAVKYKNSDIECYFSPLPVRWNVNCIQMI